MNREELIRFTSEETGIPMRRVDDAITIFTDAIINAAADGEDVKLVGFGSFKIKRSGARLVTDPRTVRGPEAERKTITIPARKTIKFEPGTKLKAALNEQEQKRGHTH